MVIARLSTVFLISIVQTCLLLADDFQATVGGAPPPEELSNAIASMVEKEAVSVIGPDGKIFAEEAFFEKMREGKFGIEISNDVLNSDRAKPGIYIIQNTIIIDGNEFTINEEFAIISFIST